MTDENKEIKVNIDGTEFKLKICLIKPRIF